MVIGSDEIPNDLAPLIEGQEKHRLKFIPLEKALEHLKFPKVEIISKEIGLDI